MASHIKKGESILIPFRNGQSISDSQLKPRMYKTMQAFEKSFPGYYLGTAGVELVEYAEVVRCKNCWQYREVLGKDSGKPCGYGICKLPSGMKGIVFDECFCSYGERKDNVHGND